MRIDISAYGNIPMKTFVVNVICYLRVVLAMVKIYCLMREIRPQ